MLFLGLFFIFLILSGKLTVEIVCVGLALSGLVTYFACRFFGWNKRQERTLLRQTGNILRYAPTLFVEIIKANLGVMKLILSPKLSFKPYIFSFDSHLNSELTRTILADSITITPGTITVGLVGERLTVHALDESFVFADEELCFQQDLLAAERLEGNNNA